MWAWRYESYELPVDVVGEAWAVRQQMRSGPFGGATNSGEGWFMSPNGRDVPERGCRRVVRRREEGFVLRTGRIAAGVRLLHVRSTSIPRKSRCFRSIPQAARRTIWFGRSRSACRKDRRRGTQTANFRIVRGASCGGTGWFDDSGGYGHVQPSEMITLSFSWMLD